MVGSANLHNLTVVVDDTHVNFNVTSDALQPELPNIVLGGFLSQACQKAWNNTLTVITAPSVSYWYNFTGYTRVAVYGSIYGWYDVPGAPSPWANYTINGEYTAGNITGAPKVITDYPLFVSGPLDPEVLYILSVDVSASPDAPYVLDYLMGYQQPTPTPLAANGARGSSSNFPVGAVVGGIAGGIALLVLAIGAVFFFLCRRRRRKLVWIEKLDDDDEPLAACRSTLPGSSSAPSTRGTIAPRIGTIPLRSERPSHSRSMSISFALDTRMEPTREGRHMGSIASTSRHSRSSSQLPLLTATRSPTPSEWVPESSQTPMLEYSTIDMPLFNPYELFPPSGATAPASTSTSTDTYPGSRTSRSTSIAHTLGPVAGPSRTRSLAATLELGPNGYPKEKLERRDTIGIEPSRDQLLYAVNADSEAGHAPSGDDHHPVSPSDSLPPAYGT